MMTYKPETLEENYFNIETLRNNFWRDVNSFYWGFNEILNKYGNPASYNLALCQGRINPFCNSFEREVFMLACQIVGYTVHVYETLSYALDFCMISKDGKQKRNVSSKNYDQAIHRLAKMKKIDEETKKHLLRFRQERNFCVHYGQVIFCNYIFKNFTYLQQLINLIYSWLGEQQMDLNCIKSYERMYDDLVEKMKVELLKYESELRIA